MKKMLTCFYIYIMVNDEKKNKKVISENWKKVGHKQTIN